MSKQRLDTVVEIKLSADAMYTCKYVVDFFLRHHPQNTEVIQLRKELLFQILRIRKEQGELIVNASDYKDRRAKNPILIPPKYINFEEYI